MQTGDVESGGTGSRAEVFVTAELIRAQYANMPGAFIGSAVTASFMAAVLYEKLSPGVLLAWLAAAYLNCSLRAALWYAFRRADPTPERAPAWGRYASMIAVVAGVVWGVSGIVLRIPDNLSYQIVVLLVTTGLAFTSAHLQSAYLPAYRAFTYPTFILAALPFLLGHDAWRAVIGVATLGAAPLVLLYAQGLARSLRASIETRLQNVALVDELRAQKKAAEDANVAKSRFLAVASHDLRQPMHALSLFVQALEDTTLPVHAQQLVSNVRRSVDSMEELFDALLDISRLDAGAIRPRVEVIALSNIFEALAFEYAPIAQQKRLSLTVLKTSVYVRSDPTLLARIVRNLLANAVRYTDSGRVVLGCRRRGDRVRIEVWDTGRGIPHEKHEEIFREFAQLANPERDRRKGLGLGLAIVDRLARLLGHDVQLRSTLGRGSVFSVSVQRAARDERVVREPAAEPAARFDLRGRLALLAHEDRAAREELVALLAGWHCEVIAAPSAAELVERAAGLQRSPDLIIAGDVVCGDSGAAVVELLRNEFNADVPALLVANGNAAAGPAGEVRDPNLPVLRRPYNAGRLRTLINNVLHARATQARRAS